MWDVEGNLSELHLCVCVCAWFCLSMHPASDYILHRWHHCGGTGPHIRFYSRSRSTVLSVLQTPVVTILDVVLYHRGTNQQIAIII